MDRGFGVASSSLVVDFHRLEHRPLPLSILESQNGVEEEDGSPFEEIGVEKEYLVDCEVGQERKAPSQAATLPKGATFAFGVSCELRRGGRAQSLTSTHPKGATHVSGEFCKLRRGGKAQSLTSACPSRENLRR